MCGLANLHIVLFALCIFRNEVPGVLDVVLHCSCSEFNPYFVHKGEVLWVQ